MCEHHINRFQVAVLGQPLKRKLVVLKSIHTIETLMTGQKVPRLHGKVVFGSLALAKISGFRSKLRLQHRMMILKSQKDLKSRLWHDNTVSCHGEICCFLALVSEAVFKR